MCNRTSPHSHIVWRMLREILSVTATAQRENMQVCEQQTHVTMGDCLARFVFGTRRYFCLPPHIVYPSYTTTKKGEQKMERGLGNVSKSKANTNQTESNRGKCIKNSHILKHFCITF